MKRPRCVKMENLAKNLQNDIKITVFDGFFFIFAHSSEVNRNPISTKKMNTL